jgi:predicted phage terminase large subunit-like protein
VKALNERFNPTTILIEDRASGTQLAQELRYERMWNVRSVEPKGDKIMRMMAQTPLIESGRVFIPERASWLDAYLHELQVFPKGRYDDQVDSTSQALEFVKDIKPETGSQAFYRIENEKRQLATAKWNTRSKDR